MSKDDYAAFVDAMPATNTSSNRKEHEMPKVKCYYEILVLSDVVEEIIDYLENDGYTVEKSVPANSEWVSKLAGPGIGFLSTMQSEPIFYDIVYSGYVDFGRVLELTKCYIEEKPIL